MTEKLTNEISIHAPLWDATMDSDPNYIKRLISIHAPLWDATVYGKSTKRILSIFQSTRPCGTRPKNNGFSDFENIISIHAPLWDATGQDILCLIFREYFNPRAPVGRDRNILYHLLRLYIFNNNFDSINSEKNSFSITFYLNPISKNV